jgi:hypothetical protein
VADSRFRERGAVSMRLIGLLSFYDEPVTDLVACVKGLADAGVTELVAVDGAYALYPNGLPASHPNQHAAITLACRQVGIGCTLHVPPAVWAGNEVEKRTFLFALGWAIADDGDWFWVQDADMVPVDVPDDFMDRLERTSCDTGEVEVFDTVADRAQQKDWPARFVMRSLFRAQPIRVQTNHITYVAEDGRLLWGWEREDSPLEPALDLTDLVVEHRPDRRPAERQFAKLCYYQTRDAEKVERGDCARCGDPSVQLVATNWRRSEIGPVAEWAEACETCAPLFEFEAAEQLRRLGIDPASVQVENRNGQAPEPVR